MNKDLVLDQLKSEGWVLDMPERIKYLESMMDLAMGLIISQDAECRTFHQRLNEIEAKLEIQ